MPTQEERITVLEKTFTTFQKEAGSHIKETDENTTIMLGVIRHQGQDLKIISQRIETIEERLNIIDNRLDRIETMISQILERLPKAP